MLSVGGMVNLLRGCCSLLTHRAVLGDHGRGDAAPGHDGASLDLGVLPSSAASGLAARSFLGDHDLPVG